MAIDSSGAIDPGLNTSLGTIDLIQSSDTAGSLGGITPPGGGLPGFGDIFNLIPGGQAIQSLVSVIGQIVPAVEAAVGDAVIQHPITYVAATFQHLTHMTDILSMDANRLWTFIGNNPFQGLYDLMLQEGLGLDVSGADADAKRGITTVGKMIAFAYGLTVVAGGLDILGEGILANRWGKALTRGIMELPEEMGLSWAMGMQIDRAFETAVGRSIEEWINAAKRPNKPEWPIARTLLRQHLITEGELNELMQAAGYSDAWIDKIKRLTDAQLPIGDLAAMYQYEIVTAAEVEAAVKELGFNATDSRRVVELYVNRAQTEASTLYRSTARRLAAEQLITLGDYRTILEHSNFPTRQIDQDVAALQLELTTGHLRTSSSVVKSETLHGMMTDSQATLSLQSLGYTAEAATQTVRSWHLEPIRRTHGLSQAKILSYLLSGLITAENAKTRLLATGLSSDDADFLIAHPVASNGVRVHQLTPSLVVTALLDGAITTEELPAALQRAGLTGSMLSYWEQIATYKLTHRKGGVSGEVTLTAGEIREAFKVGVFDQATATSALELLGYSSTNALVLLEITNKGVIRAPEPPPFASVLDALAYLSSLGWTYSPPESSETSGAIQMAEAAGYILYPPEHQISH